MSGVSEAAISLGTVLAGLFVHGYLYITYYIMIAVSIIVLILIWLIKEPTMKKKNDEVLTMNVHVLLLLSKAIARLGRMADFDSYVDW